MNIKGRLSNQPFLLGGIMDYNEHRLADLKSDREQLLFWLHKTEEEIKEIEDARDKQDTLR